MLLVQLYKIQYLCCICVIGAALQDKYLYCICDSALHLAARDGMVPVTQMLLAKGASVFAVDEKGRYPALSCAPNERIADCLELIISQMMQVGGATPRASLSRGSLSGLVNSTIGECLHMYGCAVCDVQ